MNFSNILNITDIQKTCIDNNQLSDYIKQKSYILCENYSVPHLLMFIFLFYSFGNIIMLFFIDDKNVLYYYKGLNIIVSALIIMLTLYTLFK